MLCYTELMTEIHVFTKKQGKKDLELVSVETRSQSTFTHWFVDCCFGVFLGARCDIWARSSGGSPDGGHKPLKHTLSYSERDLYSIKMNCCIQKEFKLETEQQT